MRRNWERVWRSIMRRMGRAEPYTTACRRRRAAASLARAEASMAATGCRREDSYLRVEKDVGSGDWSGVSRMEAIGEVEMGDGR